MLKLIKLAAYVMLGYFIYELYLGLNGQASTGGEERGEQQEQGMGRTNWEGHPTTGRGVPTRVEDSGGAVSTRMVGRGVVR